MKINIVNHPLYSWSTDMRGYVSMEGDVYVTTYKNPLFVYTLLHELFHVFFDWLQLPNQYHYWLDVVNASTRIISNDKRRSIIHYSKRQYFGKA